MAEPFIGEVRIFAGNFAPRGYAMCNGQLLPISQNTALFSILGTTYGGNGTTNFALPNLQGMSPLHPGQGPGLSPYVLGQTGGQTAHTLSVSELPAHAHSLHGSSAATGGTPGGGVVLAATSGAKVYRGATNLVPMATGLSANGGGQPHENRQPFLVLTFIIAVQGVFPSRN
jgi:microcystin-dependent protein